YACLAERALNRTLLGLDGLSVMKALPLAAFTAGRGRAPSEPTSEPVAMWVGALSEGRVLGGRRFTCRGDYRTTATITVGLGEGLMAAASRGQSGCFDPDELFTVADLEPGWRAAGIELGSGV